MNQMDQLNLSLTSSANEKVRRIKIFIEGGLVNGIRNDSKLGQIKSSVT